MVTWQSGSVTVTQHCADGSCSFLIPPPYFISSNNNNKMSMSCGNTKKASVLLVRKLYTLMQNLGPLPDSVCLNMKLAYYDNGNTHKPAMILFLTNATWIKLNLFVKSGRNVVVWERVCAEVWDLSTFRTYRHALLFRFLFVSVSLFGSLSVCVFQSLLRTTSRQASRMLTATPWSLRRSQSSSPWVRWLLPSTLWRWTWPQRDRDWSRWMKGGMRQWDRNRMLELTSSSKSSLSQKIYCL